MLVHDGDGQTHVLELDTDATLVIETSHGTNTVEVSGGKVRIIEADCPNGDCLRQNAISEPGQQLICLPHQLWVEIVPEGGESGELDIDAVSTEDASPKSVDAVSR